MTAQSGERERRDIDPGEGRGTGAERVHDRRSNDRGVRDGQRHAFARQRLREPGAGPFDQTRDRPRRAGPRIRPVRAQQRPLKRDRASARSRSRSAPFRLRRRSPAPRPSRAPARSALQRRGVAAPARLRGRRRRRIRANRRRETGPRASPPTRHAQAVEARCHGRARALRLSKPSADGPPSPPRNRVGPKRQSRARAPST